MFGECPMLWPLHVLVNGLVKDMACRQHGRGWEGRQPGCRSGRSALGRGDWVRPPISGEAGRSNARRQAPRGDPPPAGSASSGAVSYLELATLPSAPFWARRQAEAALKAWQMVPEVIETAQLVVSELVTNANAPRGALLYPRCSREELKGGSWA